MCWKNQGFQITLVIAQFSENLKNIYTGRLEMEGACV